MKIDNIINSKTEHKNIKQKQYKTIIIGKKDGLLTLALVLKWLLPFYE